MPLKTGNDPASPLTHGVFPISIDPMNHVRKVIKSFKADRFAREPKRLMADTFKIGQYVVFDHEHEGRAVFVRSGDSSGAMPFIISRDVFESHTQ